MGKDIDLIRRLAALMVRRGKYRDNILDNVRFRNLKTVKWSDFVIY